MRSFCQRFLVASALVAAALFVAVEVQLVSASCTLDATSVPAQPISTIVDANREIVESIDVNWSQSPGTGSWTVYYSYTSGNSTNIDNGGTDPTSATYQKDSILYTSSQETITLEGELDPNEIQGTFQLSFWDGTSWECSGSHDVTVNE